MSEITYQDLYYYKKERENVSDNERLDDIDENDELIPSKEGVCENLWALHYYSGLCIIQ